MTFDNNSKRTKIITQESVEKIFKHFFYSQPILINELPAQKLLITIQEGSDIKIGQDKTEGDKEITFQEEVNFYPFFLQTKKTTYIMVVSTFSLYDHISREPYLETKSEYEFQQELRKALKLTGGYVYYLPGDSNDFILDKVNLEDVLTKDLSLRYEHDIQYSFLFILI